MKDFNELEKMLDEKRFRLLHDELAEENSADIAALLETVPIEKAVLLFRMLPKDLAAKAFADLFSEVQQSLVERLSDKEIFNVIEELFLDDAVDFIEEMPASIAKKVLAYATPETREQINHLLKYPESSAGSIMTVEYVNLKRRMTVAQAFDRIRETGLDKETVYICYVTDSERRLKGVVSVKTLLLSQPEQVINDIMETNLIITRTDADQEEIARLFEKYDLLSIPVIDSEDRLVGIITVDDIVDVVQEEATEDFQIMAAMTPSDKPYLKTGVARLATNRIVWLFVLMVAAMVTGGILEKFEKAIRAMPILTVFIPMLMDTGGNSGSQSSTLIIRGMALSEITPRDFFKVVWKEMRVGLMVGVILSSINFLRVWLTYTSNPEYGAEVMKIAGTVSATLLFTVVVANLVGGVLPIIAKKCKIDPAVMAAPLITTIVDALSLIVYFSLAAILLGI
ncbi:MAG: magnesium transporter [Oscillospiraceae bacterium]|jgi:magnesium transporter|nr:magnesium transporter [Oscillospiraceae bacterium]